MAESDELKLLTEIRDVQREHLAEYRKVTQESLALQKQAVTRQEQIARLSRRVFVASGVAMLLLLIFLFYIVFNFRTGGRDVASRTSGDVLMPSTVDTSLFD